MKKNRLTEDLEGLRACLEIPSPDLRGLESTSLAKKLFLQGHLDEKNRFTGDLEGLKV